MADSKATPVSLAYPNGFEYTQKTEVLRGTITLTAGTYNAGGIPLSFSTLEPLKTAALPFEVNVWSAVPVPALLGTYLYNYNTNTKKLQIFAIGVVSGAALSELTPGALPAYVIADVIQFRATFAKSSFFAS